jgi:hypothetical protein
MRSPFEKHKVIKLHHYERGGPRNTVGGKPVLALPGPQCPLCARVECTILFDVELRL